MSWATPVHFKHIKVDHLDARNITGVVNGDHVSERLLYITPAGFETINLTDRDTLIMLSALSAGKVVNLPTPVAGRRITVIMGATFTGTGSFEIYAPGATFAGTLIEPTTGLISLISGTTGQGLDFVAATTAGTMAEFIGTQINDAGDTAWVVRVTSNTFDKVGVVSP